MPTLVICEDGKPEKRAFLERGEYRIGSDDRCQILLPRPGVAAVEALLVVGDGPPQLEPSSPKARVVVDGAPWRQRGPVRFGQEMRIGPFVLVLKPARRRADDSPVPATDAPVPAGLQAAPARGKEEQARIERHRALKAQIHAELLRRMDLKRTAATGMKESALAERARSVIVSIIADVRDRLPPDVAPERLAKEIGDEALGLGPLEDLLEDADVTEIMVNGPDRIYVERAGRIHLSDRCFVDGAQVLAVIERIVAPVGRRIDESQPMVDARLPDGSRVNAIIAPLSLTGPVLTIRKFSRDPFTVADLVRFGTMEEEIAEFFRICVTLRRNIVISGGTGTGKTTLLNVLSSFLPPTERILTIEDAAELRLGQEHVVRLEARPPNIEGRGEVTIRDLVRNALRMRPDRIVIGECRGGESLDMLQAMNTGHDGSLTTVHANSPRDVISRLETMVLMAGVEIPARAVREQIASAIDLIIQIARLSDGRRVVSRVTEITGMEQDVITMQDLFVFRQTGVSPEGRTLGRFAATGALPTFADEIEVHGLTLDRGIFAREGER